MKNLIIMILIATGFPVESLDWATCPVEGKCVVPPGCALPIHGASTIVKWDDIICVDLDEDVRYCDGPWKKYLPREWQIQGDSGRVNSWKLHPKRKMEHRQGKNDRMVLSYHGEFIFAIPMVQTKVWNDKFLQKTFVDDDPVGECQRRLRVFIKPHGSWAIPIIAHKIGAILGCIMMMLVLICCLCGGCESGSSDFFVGYALAGGFSDNGGFYDD